MVANLLPRREPALHDVALSAVGPKFTQMYVGVTIRTVLSDIGKNRIGVTLPAGHSIVHAAERKSGLIMIEFGMDSNRGPAGSLVAILARNRKRAVRARRGFPLRSGRGNT